MWKEWPDSSCLWWNVRREKWLEDGIVNLFHEPELKDLGCSALLHWKGFESQTGCDQMIIW